MVDDVMILLFTSLQFIYDWFCTIMMWVSWRNEIRWKVLPHAHTSFKITYTLKYSNGLIYKNVHRNVWNSENTRFNFNR